MTLSLLDINVLFSLAWPEAEHHVRCRDWFLEVPDRVFATCLLTEAGLLRLSLNPKLVSSVQRPSAVLLLLERYRAMPGHRFLPLDAPLGDWLPLRPLRGSKQVSDAVLLGLARRTGSRLVTLDSGLPSLCPDPSWTAHVQVL